jgi:arylsulfatase A-like enzyme
MKMRTIMRILFALFALVTLLSAGCRSQSAYEKPNVIIILTDDQGYGEVGAHGNELIRTPHMDDLYHEGVRLTDFHVNNVCSPSRAAIMTGKYSTSVGVWHTLGGRSLLDIDEETMADIFKDNAYKTCMVGKWHLGDNYPYRPEDRGFDEVLRIGGGSLGQIADYWGNGLWDGHYWNGTEWILKEGYCTDVQFGAAIDFIDRTGEEPFFIYLATTAPHSPIGAAAEYVDPYLEMGLSKEVSNFYGMVTSIDENLGRLRSYLQEKDLDKNTILIFMSDNGSACAKKDTSIYNAGMRGKKGSDYEGGHRVPCFIYWPYGKLIGGRSLTQLTAHIDLLPTLAEACNLTAQDEVRFDGINILPALKDPNHKLLHRAIVSEGKVNDREKLFKSSCVISDQWRLVSGTELFDIEDDPAQKQPVHDETKTDEMRSHYMNWHSSVSNVFEDEYYFIYSDEHSSTPFVTMDLLPDGINEKPKSVWNQSAVKKGIMDRGVWNIDFPEAGIYTFRLCRFPDEAALSQGEKMKMSDMNIHSAYIVIDGEVLAESDKIDNGQAKIKVNMSEGKHKIAANFTDKYNNSFSAYCLYISGI